MPNRGCWRHGPDCLVRPRRSVRPDFRGRRYFRRGNLLRPPARRQETFRGRRYFCRGNLLRPPARRQETFRCRRDPPLERPRGCQSVCQPPHEDRCQGALQEYRDNYDRHPGRTYGWLAARREPSAQHHRSLLRRNSNGRSVALYPRRAPRASVMPPEDTPLPGLLSSLRK
jgi:hypothetical protein